MLILGNAELYFEKNLYEKLCVYKDFKIKKINKPFDVISLGYSLGFKKVETLDINGKASLKINLQNKLPKALLSQYDFIIDSGVLFWCFDPEVLALKNIYKMKTEERRRSSFTYLFIKRALWNLFISILNYLKILSHK